jgi:isopentenyl-diphosphate Delta-isomerase
MPATDPTELFDVCDEHDRVIGQAPRGEVHARGLLHRAVHIFVFNSREELLLHRRSTQKDEYPLRITSSASGHLAVGEDYATAAVRELEEELGLRAPLDFAAKFPASRDTANEHTHLYLARSDAPPVPDPDEIAELEWATPAEVARRIADNPEDFTPPFLVLFEWYDQERNRERREKDERGTANER